ncbi:MAG: sigma-54-dependent Fis family transcriptional regulator [Deltaproteobacteria bacterium]|nr:sigma-54-dependent Fis family transcriptional regulator [Deltaproteobacteria bacterium]
MPETKQILVVDDEPNLRRVLGGILRRGGHQVLSAGDGREALNLLTTETVHAVITDLRMPHMDGMELLRRISADYPDVPVIILTAHGSVDNAVAAVKLGAFDYLEKPFDQQQIQQVIAKALRTNELRRAQPQIAGGASSRGRYGLIGTSAAMQAVYNVIEKVADSPSTVLITGESGTGKELIARALHEQSPRTQKPLITVNCAAIPDTLIESELFGYEKGAFTGAVSSKPGRFELADSGTLFLDEIGEIPFEMQVKLLRALQENEFERVGGIRTLKVDARVVAATNRDLAAEIERGNFREDLYYRLNVVPIQVPPLRDRPEDLPALVEHILHKLCIRLERPPRSLNDDAMELLAAYAWPGNIRELENMLERTLLFSEQETIGAEDLPLPLREAPEARRHPRRGETNPKRMEASLKEAVRAETERVERQMILSALEETGGNVTHAAKRLKISRKSLQIKMRDLGLREPASGSRPKS